MSTNLKTFKIPDILMKFSNDMETALLYEATSWPSPGLVSAIDSGSHGDMDIYTFLKSGVCLKKYWEIAINLGFSFDNTTEMPQLFPKLRSLGLKAEDDMLKSTNGINTHKGTIFLGILLCAGVGICCKNEKKITAEKVCEYANLISHGHLNAQLNANHYEDEMISTGLKAYKHYGLQGIRGEVNNGFKTIINHSLPCYRSAINNGYSIKDSICQTLLVLMAVTEDTTLLNREFNIERIRYVKNWANYALQHGGAFTKEGKELIDKMHKAFIKRSLSPGGSADLLIMTLALDWWERT